jgi:hypothetical protein
MELFDAAALALVFFQRAGAGQLANEVTVWTPDVIVTTRGCGLKDDLADLQEKKRFSREEAQRVLDAVDQTIREVRAALGEYLRKYKRTKQ